MQGCLERNSDAPAPEMLLLTVSCLNAKSPYPVRGHKSPSEDLLWRRETVGRASSDVRRVLAWSLSARRAVEPALHVSRR